LIEAVHESHIPGAGYAYFCVIVGVFVTAFYSFRLVFMTFHGKERFAHEQAHAAHGHEDHGHDDHAHDDHGHGHHSGPPHETPWVVTLPLVLLAIPSVIIGWVTIGPLLFGDYFDGAIFVSEAHDVLGEIEFHGPLAFLLHAFKGPAIYLAGLGVLCAWFLYLKRPELAAQLRERAGGLYTLLENKYYFDWFNENVIARGSRLLGTALWKGGDVALIDGAAVNGSARVVGWVAQVARGLQSGFLYHYAFATIIGLSLLLAWLLWRS
jgi:NADH-quinone oxidoreductase subunit L